MKNEGKTNYVNGQLISTYTNHTEVSLGTAKSITDLHKLNMNQEEKGFNRDYMSFPLRLVDELKPLKDYVIYDNGVTSHFAEMVKRDPQLFAGVAPVDPVVQVRVAPRNYNEYVEINLGELLFQPVVTLLSWGNPESEMRTIYQVSKKVGGSLANISVTHDPENFEYRIIQRSAGQGLSAQVRGILKTLPLDVPTLVDLPADFLTSRVSLYTQAKRLGMKVSVSNDDGRIRVTRLSDKESESVTKKLTALLKEIPDDEPQAVDSDLDAKSVRNRLYSIAHDLGIDVSVSINDGICYVTKVYQKQTRQALFDEFVDSIKPGEAKPLPASMSDVSGSYIRVLCSNHAEKLTFRKGLVGKPAAPATNPEPHIDSTGNFWMNGKNLGPRNDVFITLKLKPFGLTAEDLK